MKVLVMTTGCRYEGGSVSAVFQSEESALRYVRNYMQREQRSDKKYRQRVFLKRKIEVEDDTIVRYWLKCRQIEDGSVFDSDYIMLKWYELQ